MGNASNQIRILFRFAAQRAAVQLGHPNDESAVYFWLDLLKQHGVFYKRAAGGGEIYRVCDASAEYCVKCETDAIAARREGKGEGARGGVGAVQSASQVRRPSRFEIEKFANERFTAARGERIDGLERAAPGGAPKKADGTRKSASPERVAERARARQVFLAPFRKKRSLNALAEDWEIEYSSLHRWQAGKSSKLSTENRAKLAEHTKMDVDSIPV